MKYVLLVHSNPQPWGHPTSDFVAEHQALPQAERDQLNAEFDALMKEMSSRSEIVGCEPLGDPANARIFRWRQGRSVSTDGPYSESKEHLAGFFLLDLESPERADEVASRFAGPGETVELRPVMWPGGDEQ